MYSPMPDHAAVEEYVRVLTAPGAMTAALNWYRAMGRDFRDLPSVKVPTTYVWSTADVAVARAARNAATNTPTPTTNSSSWTM